MRRRVASRLVAGLAGGAVLAACSSAPAPTSLVQDGGTTGGLTAGGTPVHGAVGGTVPGTPGGTTGTAPATGGGSSTGAQAPGTGPAVPGTTGGSTGGTSGVVAPARTTLFTPAEDRIGITPTSLTMCAHAALTYGQAFGTKDSDFNVYWQALNTEKGGIFGRKVSVSYENDNYTPTDAVKAATACKAKNPFMLLGGIGFDQIPAVRNWADANHMLYLHHSATVQGSQGKKYSFTELPTVERLGEGFAQLAVAKYKGKRIGIIERDSSNWAPGVQAFKAMAKKAGLTIVADKAVATNKANYTDELTAMRNAKADVVWVWLNALESTQLIKQSKVQQFSPNWLMFPFNLTSQTLDGDAMTPPLDGVAMYPAYSQGDYSGSFAPYASDMKEFERQYRQYDPDVDLSGIGGDLLFLNWTAQKALHVQLLQCGKDCTRNRFVDVLLGYTGQSPGKTACPIDFRGDGHHGSDSVVFMQTYRAASGKVNWRNTAACVRP
ncbi:MAG: amino acid-binding protein [Frankiales bacterium]|nr:amino acid-binding protein [Frankiales bacterium]